MIRLIRLGALILLLSSQHSEAQDVQFGLKGGIHYSTYRSDIPILDYSGKLGFFIGGFGLVKVSDVFAVRPELFLSNKNINLFVDYNRLNTFDPENSLPDSETHEFSESIGIDLMYFYG